MIYEVALTLLDDIKLSRKVRLIGLTISNLSTLGMEQLSLFD